MISDVRLVSASIFSCKCRCPEDTSVAKHLSVLLMAHFPFLNLCFGGICLKRCFSLDIEYNHVSYSKRNFFKICLFDKSDLVPTLMSRYKLNMYDLCGGQIFSKRPQIIMIQATLIPLKIHVGSVQLRQLKQEHKARH